MREEKVQQEALSAARGSQHERMADILNVQGEVERREMPCLQHRQRLMIQMATPRLTPVDREEEAEVCVVRFEDGQSPKVMSTVAGNDAEPRIQQVVRLFEQCSVVRRHYLDCFGSHLLQGLGVSIKEDEHK